MKKLSAALLALTLLASIPSFCAADTATADKPAVQVTETEKYSNTEKGYTLSYPSSWKKTDVPRLDLVLFAPPKGNDANSHASMNIVSENVGQGITLEQFYSESAANLTSALKDVQVEKSGSSSLGGTTTKWILYTHIMQNIKFRVLQYFLVANDTVFLLTFSAVADSSIAIVQISMPLPNRSSSPNQTPPSRSPKDRAVVRK